MNLPAYFLETVIGIALIAIFGYSYDSTDVLFYQTYPHPFLFLVIFISIRYGAMPATVSAVTLCTAYLLAAWSQEKLAGDILHISNMQIPLRIFVSASIFGTICEGQHQRRRDLQEDLAEVSQKYEILESNHRSLEMIKEKLQERIALEHNTIFPLLDDFRKMLMTPQIKILSSLPRILQKHLETKKVAIYIKKGAEYVQVVQKNFEELPQDFRENIPAIVQKCQDTKELISIREADDGSNIWLCAPLGKGNEQIGYILAGKMPFLQFHRKNEKILQLIATWTTHCLSLGERREDEK